MFLITLRKRLSIKVIRMRFHSSPGTDLFRAWWLTRHKPTGPACTEAMDEAEGGEWRERTEDSAGGSELMAGLGGTRVFIPRKVPEIIPSFFAQSQEYMDSLAGQITLIPQDMVYQLH